MIGSRRVGARDGDGLVLQGLERPWPLPGSVRYAGRVDRQEVIERTGAYFGREGEGVVCAYVFGSVGRGEAQPGSDVDVAVLLDAAPPATLAGCGLRLEGELERALGREVDLVVLNRAPVDLVHRVLRDGVLAFEADAAARVRFEVRARNVYFDLRPILDRYRRTGEACDDRR